MGQRGNSSGRLSRGQGTGWLAEEERREKKKGKTEKRSLGWIFLEKKNPGGKEEGEGIS